MDVNDKDARLLVRLDERLISIQNELKELHHAIKELHEEVDKNILSNKSEYVTQKEFEPVKKLVYAASGLILTAFLGAIFSLVFGVNGRIR